MTSLRYPTLSMSSWAPPCKTSQATENFLNQLDIFFPWKSWWTCGVIVCRSLYHYEYVLVYWYLNYVSYISFGVLRKGFFLLYLSSFVSKQKYTMSWKDKKECCFDVNCQIHIRSFNLIVVFTYIPILNFHLIFPFLIFQVRRKNSLN